MKALPPLRYLSRNPSPFTLVKRIPRLSSNAPVLFPPVTSLVRADRFNSPGPRPRLHPSHSHSPSASLPITAPHRHLRKAASSPRSPPPASASSNRLAIPSTQHSRMRFPPDVAREADEVTSGTMRELIGDGRSAWNEMGKASRALRLCLHFIGGGGCWRGYPVVRRSYIG
ncbi:hypothetical protein K438DRAFT_1973417 [Mycena galopus ATCC 62051]|nr:hypothetical protein K438DRAFT_1973417 [Mycena galopus ATCC 62051]